MNSPVADSPLPLGFEDAMEPRSRSGLSRLMLWVTTCSIVFSTTYLLFRTMAMIQDPEAGFSCWAMLYLEASLAGAFVILRTEMRSNAVFSTTHFQQAELSWYSQGSKIAQESVADCGG